MQDWKKRDAHGWTSVVEHKIKGAQWQDTMGPFSTGPVLSDMRRKFPPVHVNLETSKFPKYEEGHGYVTFFFFYLTSLLSCLAGELREVLNGNTSSKEGPSGEDSWQENSRQNIDATSAAHIECWSVLCLGCVHLKILPRHLVGKLYIRPDSD